MITTESATQMYTDAGRAIERLRTTDSRPDEDLVQMLEQLHDAAAAVAGRLNALRILRPDIYRQVASDGDSGAR